MHGGLGHTHADSVLVLLLLLVPMFKFRTPQVKLSYH